MNNDDSSLCCHLLSPRFGGRRSRRASRRARRGTCRRTSRRTSRGFSRRLSRRTSRRRWRWFLGRTRRYLLGRTHGGLRRRRRRRRRVASHILSDLVQEGRRRSSASLVGRADSAVHLVHFHGHRLQHLDDLGVPRETLLPSDVLQLPRHPVQIDVFHGEKSEIRRAVRAESHRHERDRKVPERHGFVRRDTTECPDENALAAATEVCWTPSWRREEGWERTSSID